MATGVMRAWFAKEDAKRGYTAPCKVENKICFATTLELDDIVKEYNKNGYELSQLIYRKLNYCGEPERYGWVLLFTRKKIKTYYDGE